MACLTPVAAGNVIGGQLSVRTCQISEGLRFNRLRRPATASTVSLPGVSSEADALVTRVHAWPAAKAIERGPARQPDGPHDAQKPNPFSFAPDLLHHRPQVATRPRPEIQQ